MRITDTELRLPPNHYRAVLYKFAELGKRHSFTPVFMTAPAALNEENLQRMVVQLGWARDPMRIRARHDRYVEITRETAKTKDVPLVDLVALFARQGGEPLIHSDGESTPNGVLPVTTVPGVEVGSPGSEPPSSSSPSRKPSLSRSIPRRI